MDNRKYDINLVYAIREKEYTRNENGIEVTYKPIPDDEYIGMTKEVFGAVPEGYIKYYPGRIFDKRKVNGDEAEEKNK